MNYVEYGKENSDVIILLHGGGLSWWNYKEVACNNAYCINEKKAIKLLETFEYKPKKYAERVNHIFEILGLSLFECYDMTEKLYKEVKKIATEINNFLNEGEFR